MSILQIWVWAFWDSHEPTEYLTVMRATNSIYKDNSYYSLHRYWGVMRTMDASRYVEDPAIRSMRVRTWFRAVTLASGLTPAQLEREFSERDRARAASARSCIWDKYRRGEVVPRSSSMSPGRPGLVERVERRYPGTAAWLSSPLWRLADKAPMEMSELRRIYEGMPQPIRSIFVSSKKEAPGLFWRRPVDIDHACEILLRFQSVEGFVAVLAIVKEAETTQEQYQHYTGVDAAWVYMRETALPRDQVLGSIIRTDLSEYLESRWQNLGYLDVPDAPDELDGCTED